MSGRVGYVVQCLQSWNFLCPQDGDVGFTPALHAAGSFDDYQAAFDTAVLILGDGFKITEVWVHANESVS